MKIKLLSLCLALCLTLAVGCARQTAGPQDTAEDVSDAQRSDPASAPEEAGPAEPDPAAEAGPEAPKPLTYRIERTDLSEGYPVSMYYELPVFSGGVAAATEKIDRALAVERQEYLEGRAKDELQMVIDSLHGPYAPTAEAPYVNEHDAAVTTCTEDLVSVTLGYNWWMGGVADYGVVGRSFNAKTGEQLFLTDLLEGTDDEIRESIVNALLEQYPGVEDAGVMETPMDAIRAMDIRAFNFYVQNGAVHVAFNKYAITYGAAGAFDVVLPNALKPLN